MTIGERIKSARMNKGYSQTELAELLGYKSRSSINKIEKDGRDIPRSTIVRLANLLDVTPAYLMGWDEEPQANKKSAPQLSETDAKGLEVFRKLSDKDKEMFLQLMADRLNSRQE